MEKIRAMSLELYTRVVNREEGQGLVEYALILVLVSIASIVVLRILGVDIDGVFESVESALDGTDDADPAPAT
jgi:pilus assembly protein Flp/PilA